MNLFIIMEDVTPRVLTICWTHFQHSKLYL
nr:unnamed protein product [Callosobruchus analis]